MTNPFQGSGYGLASTAPAPSSVSGSGTLASMRVDMTGYATPSTTSQSQVKFHDKGVTFVVPASGWVRVTFSGTAWTSATNVKENWFVLNETLQALPHSEMTVTASTTPTFITYVYSTNYDGPFFAGGKPLVPGTTHTWYWGWDNPPDGTAGTAFLDNAVSTIRIDAIDAPIPPSVSNVSTVQNIATVGGAGASQTATWTQAPQAGDLMLAVFLCNVAPASWVPPAGWAVAKTQQIGTTARYVGLLWKIANNAEPLSPTFTGTAATISTLHMWTKRGFSGVPAVDLTAGFSADAYTTGTNLVTGAAVATAPELGVCVLGTGANVATTKIGNGWDYPGGVFSDTSTASIGASELLLLSSSRFPQIGPVIGAAQSVGALIVTFTNA